MAAVESVTSSVVREYLSRKGLKSTLAMLDNEMPRTDNCINNRAQLAKELHINSLMKKNKQSQTSFRTMLEVVVQFMMTKAWAKLSPQSSLDKTNKESDSSTNVSPRENDAFGKQALRSKETEGNFMKGLRQSVADKQKNRSQRTEFEGGDGSGLREINETSASNSEFRNDMDLSASVGEKETGHFRRRTTPSEELVLDLNKSSKNLSNSRRKVNLDTERDLRSLGSKSPSRDRTKSSVMENDFSTSFKEELSLEDHLRKQSRRQRTPEKESLEKGVTTEDLRTNYVHDKRPRDSSPLKKSHNLRSKSSRRQTGTLSGTILSTDLRGSRKNESIRYLKESLTEDFDRPYEISNSKTIPASKSEGGVPAAIVKSENKNEMPAWKKDVIKNKEEKRKDAQNTSRSSEKKSYDELIFEDVDENLDEELENLNLDVCRRPTVISVQTQPITLQTAKDLKSVTFGSSLGVFNPEWSNQGFSFSQNKNLKYGIVQRKGGPCGLLASVQAILLRHLLFSDNSTQSTAKEILRFSSKETHNALCSAITEIIWRAGSYKKACVTLPSDRDQFVPGAGYKSDKLTEKLSLYEFYDKAELELFVKENINKFSSDSESGSILLLYSVILSRTVKMIREDMDDPNGTLMGAHGYCSQDMVNLLLTGKAVSNTFDNIIELDAGGETKNILKGIDKQSDVGLLSLFEYYKSCLVGSHLKNPRYPIWVVCSESHFSVLFSPKRSLLNERRAQKKFDLYYYDGLAKQDEEIRLTVDTSALAMDRDIPDDLTPPLELCIRTKWKDAVVDWNGTEPLL